MRNPSNKTYDAVESAIESSKALRGTWDELARRSNVELWEEDAIKSFSEPPHQPAQPET
jgi:hypothetical protein